MLYNVGGWRGCAIEGEKSKVRLRRIERIHERTELRWSPDWVT